MATDILSDSFAIRDIRSISHMAPGSPWKIPGNPLHTQHREVHGKPLLSQQGSSPAHSMAQLWGTWGCPAALLERRWRYVKIMWKSLGTRNPADSWLLCSPSSLGSSSAPSSSMGWVLMGRWETQSVPWEQVWGLCRLSEHSPEERQFRCLLDTTRFCKSMFSVLVLPRCLIGAVTENVGLQKIPKWQNKDHIVKIKAVAFRPSSWSHIINLFRNLLVHSQPVGTLSIFFLSFLGISLCNYTSLLPYIFP